MVLPSCKEILNETLFRIINDKLEPIYHFKLGKYAYLINDQKLPYKDLIQNWSNYIFINKVFETKNHFFVECDLGKHTPNNIAQLHQPVLGVYTKIDNQFFFIKAQDKDSVKPESIYNNVDAGPSFFPMVSVNDSTLAMWIDANQLKAHIASKAFKISTPKYPAKKKELERLANSLDENDNPVLMLVKLKE